MRGKNGKARIFEEAQVDQRKPVSSWEKGKGPKRLKDNWTTGFTPGNMQGEDGENLRRSRSEHCGGDSRGGRKRRQQGGGSPRKLIKEFK